MLRLILRSVLDCFSIALRSVLVRSSIGSRSSFVYPSFILRSSFVRESKNNRRWIEEVSEVHLRQYGGNTEMHRTALDCSLSFLTASLVYEARASSSSARVRTGRANDFDEQIFLFASCTCRSMAAIPLSSCMVRIPVMVMCFFAR